MPLALTVLAGIAELWLASEQPKRSVEFFALVFYHSASDQETRNRVGLCLARARGELTHEVFMAAEKRGQSGDVETAITVLRAEASAGVAFEPRAAPANRTRTGHASQHLIEPLTTRELEVLELIAARLTNMQIAERLVISVDTAKSYTSQIYSKRGVNNRTQAVARARGLELID